MGTPMGLIVSVRIKARGFPGGPVVKNPPVIAGATGSIPGPGTKMS